MAFLDTIDITNHTEMYDRLVAKISADVASTQQDPRPHALPDKIIMTKRQQKMLRRYKMMQQMMGTTQRLWLTPWNVMEVTVEQ